MNIFEKPLYIIVIRQLSKCCSLSENSLSLTLTYKPGVALSNLDKTVSYKTTPVCNLVVFQIYVTLCKSSIPYTCIKATKICCIQSCDLILIELYQLH